MAPNLIGFFILVFMIFLVLRMIRRGKGSFLNTQSIWMGGGNNTHFRDIDGKLINYYHEVLTKYVEYYRKLDREGRKKFINRLHELIEMMEFKGEQGQPINLKVCTLCCAPVIQITMGLDTYLFNSFHTIVVYPTRFFSERQGTYVKGGVSRGDVIFFSWEDLQKGFEIPNDALNLGLHEMAHAIHIEYFDEEFERRFPAWELVATAEVGRMRGQSDPVLRNYAGQNKHELFAVCVETFFEQPNEMKLKAPGLYESLCRLLNQNPLGKNY